MRRGQKNYPEECDLGIYPEKRELSTKEEVAKIRGHSWENLFTACWWT
ncbi:hypothetical protein [Alteromonas naphthalenivorans]|uniref:Uncharacterized protein n=1 Tax=Alteromonas naphthalenivorans TaxID=715451 RepID=F5Z6X2_ALTNA|nr:hypothetical protein [Alteromonas naphthalenivorans]AEF05635.1 hypothetical protein ambt_20720 [Alteromonas naphthalenivorans]